MKRGSLGAGLLLAGVVAWGGAAAERIVRDADGRRILLHEDRTWEYVDAEAPEARVVLSVERVESGPNSCTVGLRLENELGEEVRSLVPQFSAFTEGDVRFETVFQSFSWIKPTQDQYQELRFSGIRCSDIERIQVHGADRCSMGDLSKFSFERGECLRRIQVAPSPLIRIGK